MAQGRKPLPTHLKMVKGTDRKHRTNTKEPKPKADAIKCPGTLSPMAKKHWNNVCKQLKDAGVITNLDVTALAMYCESYAMWQDATDKINTHGAVVKGKDGYPVRSPYFMVMQRSFDQMKAMLTEFGMTPSSRTKVSVVEKEKPSDGWDSF